MSFLPTGYKEPVESNYMEFQEGNNTFRVLGSATIGWEYWSNKMVEGEMKARPTRVKSEDSIPLEDVLEGKYGLQIYYFWAFPVYNLDAEKIQVLAVKQKTVRQAMKNYIDNPKWGDPTKYNFVVSKEKVGDKTTYTTAVEPKDELDKQVLAKFKSMNIDMSIWMAGNDPFKSVSSDQDEAQPPKLSARQIADEFEASLA